ncbi:MAG: AtzE family amidohydrolase [Gammaproteobacteria bacterium]
MHKTPSRAAGLQAAETAIAGAAGLADALRAGRTTARASIEAVLHRITQRDGVLNACTKVFAAEALEAADRIDVRLRAGDAVGPLAGVPVVVKNLFDVRGHVTLAGARSRLGIAPAADDATVIARLRAAGAIIVAATNMDEFAYGFTTENQHFGTTRNPRDPAHLAGGSSGGSAAAVAAGMGCIGLGSDTNGSIRVPASYCGVFGMKPTFGRLSRAGVFPFAASFDHVGHLARSVEDLALAYDVMQGPDRRDPACAARSVEPGLPALSASSDKLRIARLAGWFESGADAETIEALDRVARCLKVVERVELPEAGVARAAAFIVTAAEGGNLHRDALARDPEGFDPGCRDRLLAGLLMPAHVLLQAQRFRRRFQAAMQAVFQRHDVLLAPATPSPALRVGQTRFDYGGRSVNARAHIGIYTQPLSFIGLPIVVAPVHRPGKLPVGVQIIAAPWREDQALQIAARLERAGLASSPVAA